MTKTTEELLKKVKKRQKVQTFYLEENLLGFLHKEAERCGDKSSRLVQEILRDWALSNGYDEEKTYKIPINKKTKKTTKKS